MAMRAVERISRAENGLGPTATSSRSADARRFTLVPVGLGLDIYALGHAPQGQFAQGQEVAFLEEIPRGRRRAFRDVDFAFGEPLEQIIRRQVHQLDFVGLLENRVRVWSRGRARR